MPTPRRDFFKTLLALGAFPGLAASPAAARALAAFAQEGGAPGHESDPASVQFWSSFMGEAPQPVVPGAPRGRGAVEGAQPVFFHYGPQGFKYAAELDPKGLIAEGDVSVSLNTSTIKIAPQDQAIFDHLQNAQVRVDVAQKRSILPIIEAMSYAAVAGMCSLEGKGGSKPAKGGKGAKGEKSSGKPSGGKGGGGGSIQSVSVDSDASWQKMQNIPLPKGEGRWGLNLEAQKKDSFLGKLLREVVKVGGQFGPLLSLPGIAMSAMQSINILYGFMHSQPVTIIQSRPLNIFATQEAVEKTGAPGAASGIMMKRGTYVLIPADRAPKLDEIKDYTVMQGRVVPPKTSIEQLDEAAADTLRDVTYVTFDVEVTPTTLVPYAKEKSG